MPYLFDGIFMSPNRKDLETAEAMIGQFAYHIKTLTFSSVYYKAMCRTKFTLEAKRQIPRSRKKVWKHHQAYAFRKYCEVRNHQKGLLETGTCLAYLCRALRNLPNLQKLSVKDLGSEPFGSVNNLYDDRLAESLGPCEEIGCQVPQNEHLGFLVRPQSGFFHEVANSWNLVMLASWAVGTLVRELAVDSGANLPLRSFLDTEKPWNLYLIFQSLTKLRLNLVIDLDSSGREDYMDADCFRRGLVSHALSGAKNVRCLYIKAIIRIDLDEYKPMTPFQTILGTCQFPKLRSLILSGFDSTTEELLTFLGASTQLQQLTLIHHGLLSGTWEKAADCMRGFLKSLQEVVINNVHDDLAASSPVLNYLQGRYMDHFGRVQDFFFRDGPNPFNAESLAAQEQDIEDGREAIYVNCSAAAKERYQRYK